jgi:hypothetical protein
VWFFFFGCRHFMPPFFLSLFILVKLTAAFLADSFFLFQQKILIVPRETLKKHFFQYKIFRMLDRGG